MIDQPTTDNLILEQHLDRLIGRRLASLRRAAGLTMEALAARTGLPIDELTDHERGLLPLPLSRAPILCQALGCGLHKLVRTAKQGHERLTGKVAGTICRNS